MNHTSVSTPVSTSADSASLQGLRVLFVVFEYPTRGTAGYHSYNRALLKALLDAQANVHLLVLTRRYHRLVDDLADLRGSGEARLTVDAPGLLVGRRQAMVWSPHAVAAHLYRGLRARYRSRSAAGPKRIGRFADEVQGRRVQQAVETLSPDLVVLDTLFCSPLLPLAQERPAVVLAHDVFHERVSAMRQAGLQPEPAIDAAAERALLGSAQAVVAISDPDVCSLRSLLGPQARVHSFTPPLELLSGAAPQAGVQAGAPRLFYMGSGAHHNVHALEWFLAQVWPALRSCHPTLELRLAGDIGAHWAQRPVPGWTVLGRVDDPSQACRGCAAAIDPVQAGSGVKVKILSYLSLGLPCVTTPAGATGLGPYAGDVVVADDATAFIAAVLRALQGGAAAPGLDGSRREAMEAGNRAQQQALVYLLRTVVADGCQPAQPLWVEP